MKSKAKTRIIWSSEVDTSDEAIQAYREDNNLEEDCDEQEVLEMMYEDSRNWLDDERANLDIPLDHQILVIGDLGLWHGRRQGYKLIGGNVQNIFSVTCGEEAEFYADAYNIHCRDVHHDGVNRYLFRELRGSEDECWPLIDAVYSGKEITASLLNRYSRSILRPVADVYGWPVAGRKHA